MNILEELKKLRVIPVVKLSNADDAVPLAKALADGGLPAAEITFRTNAAEESIRRIAKDAPEVLLLAGTVLDVETARRAVDAGAKAIVSPGTNPAVVEWCLSQNIPALPGCATPTEVEACLRMGLHTVKLFPAEAVGGVTLLKALSGPYPDVKFMPTGGISPQNLAEYLSLSNVLCCGGSWIAPEKLLSAGEWESISRLAREAFPS